MDAFVLLFLFAFLVYVVPAFVIASRLAKIKKSATPTVPACPPHKWTYRGEGDHTYMVCSSCRMLPGLVAKEEGR